MATEMNLDNRPQRRTASAQKPRARLVGEEDRLAGPSTPARSTSKASQRPLSPPESTQSRGKKRRSEAAPTTPAKRARKDTPPPTPASSAESSPEPTPSKRPASKTSPKKKTGRPTPAKKSPYRNRSSIPRAESKAAVAARAKRSVAYINRAAYTSSSAASFNSSPTLVTSTQRDAQSGHLTLADLTALTPHQRAKRLLHVGLTPDKLPCRETEYDAILNHVLEALASQSGACIYVAGQPGTGKTATVRAVVRELLQHAAAKHCPDFDFVEINGLKIGDPTQAYVQLWQALRPEGRDARPPSAKFALAALTSYFSNRRPGLGPPSPGRWRIGTAHHSTAKRSTVVLMDEFDQLVNARQEVLYNFLNWPKTHGGRLVVIAVANTLDLPERMLSAKNASRLGLDRVPFVPYTWQQLQKIVETRLGVPQADGEAGPAPRHGGEDARELAALEEAGREGCAEIFKSDAIKLAAHRVQSVTGDARRMLDVCRRAIEMVEKEAEAAIARERRAAGQDPEDPPGRSSRSKSRTLHRHAQTAASEHEHEVSRRCKQVDSKTISDVVSAMVKSGRTSHIAHLSLSAKLLLAALLIKVRTTGLAEVRFGDVLIGQSNLMAGLRIGQATYSGSRSGKRVGVSAEAPLPAEPSPAHATGWTDWNVVSTNLAEVELALASLCQAGLVVAVGTGAGHGRAGINGRLSLACLESDLRLAFQASKDARLRNLL